MTLRDELECRYDAMPPEVVARLRTPTHAFHTLSNEVSFARRMFRSSKRFYRRCQKDITFAGSNDAVNDAHDDCSYWVKRYRDARSNLTEARLNWLAQQVAHESTYE